MALVPPRGGGLGFPGTRAPTFGTPEQGFFSPGRQPVGPVTSPVFTAPPPAPTPVFGGPGSDPGFGFPPPAFKPSPRGLGPSGPSGPSGPGFGTPEGGYFDFTPSPFFGGSPGFQTPGPARPGFRRTGPFAGTPEGGGWMPPFETPPSPGFQAPGRTRPGFRPSVPPVIAYMLGLLR